MMPGRPGVKTKISAAAVGLSYESKTLAKALVSCLIACDESEGGKEGAIVPKPNSLPAQGE
jgi:hypothetical protein